MDSPVSTGSQHELLKSLDNSGDIDSVPFSKDPDSASIKFAEQGDLLYEQYTETNDLDKLDAAIDSYKQAVLHAAQDNAEVPKLVGNLGFFYSTRHLNCGRLIDIDLSIIYNTQALSLTPRGHQGRPARLNNLGSSYLSRYDILSHRSAIGVPIHGAQDPISPQVESQVESPAWLAMPDISCQNACKHLGELADLDMAIVYTRRAVSSVAITDPDVAAFHNNLGSSFSARYAHSRVPEDANLAIHHIKQALLLTPDGTPEKPTWLNNLGQIHWSRFEDQGLKDHLDEAIECVTLAISLIPDRESSEHLHITNFLGTLLWNRYKLLGDKSDLHATIQTLEKSVPRIPKNHTAYFRSLTNLSAAHEQNFRFSSNLENLDSAIRYLDELISQIPEAKDDHGRLYVTRLGILRWYRLKRLDQREDLDKMMNLFRRSILLLKDNDPDGDICFGHLGIAYDARYHKTGDLEDLNEAIRYKQQAISYLSEGHPDKPYWLISLHLSYESLFKRLGKLSDLDISIKYAEQAVQETPKGYSRYPVYLNNLSTTYELRYQHFGNPVDLDRSVDLNEQILSIPEQQNEEVAINLNNLASSLSTRFRYQGQPADLNRALELYQRAIDLTSDEHPDKPRWYNNIGVAYDRRYRLSGELLDLDKAIENFAKAIGLAPDNDPNMSNWLNNLAGSHSTRFDQLNDMRDLDLAVDYQTRAHSTRSSEYISEPTLLIGLAAIHLRRYERLQNLEDLHNAIRFAESSVNTLPDGNLDKFNHLGWLSHAYRLRFQRLEHIEDLDLAIKYRLQIKPDSRGNQLKYTHCRNLSKLYQVRFKYQGQQADLDRALEFSTQAVTSCPEDHPLYTEGLVELSRFHFRRYTKFGYEDNLPQAISWAKRATQTPKGNPTAQLAGARAWAEAALFSDPHDALEAYSQAFDLIPRVVWFGGSTEYRYRQATVIGEMALEAATIAMTLKKVDLALEWMEAGRTIIWTQLLQLRDPFEQIAATDPSLAEKLKRVANELEISNFSERTLSSNLGIGQSSHEQAVQQRHRQAEEWESLIKQAQSIPSMQNLHRPIESSRLISAAHSGAVVSVLVSRHGCDALIIRPNAKSIEFVPLVGLHRSQLLEAQRNLADLLGDHGRASRGVIYLSEASSTIRDTLKMLWDYIAKPVLEWLDYLHIASTELPHITWCTTGPLSFLPLHAAGDYNKPGCSVFDYAVSSFTPTLSALLTPHPPRTRSCPTVLMVSQPQTPGFRPLPGITSEVNSVLRRVGQLNLTLLDDNEATATNTLARLDSHDWLHLACHASQNFSNPVESAFHLATGPLRLSEIVRKNVKDLDLAFLSACQTATGDDDIANEAVHLAAGMLMAGYRRVIATMWSIDDDDAPLVAERFYAFMLDDTKPSEAKAARGLHHAVECLRDTIGIDNFLRWAPYIHIGL
ncbi:CHAT domain protein [Ceratobasidium sp. AG-Ba]|nr:CHAT domain protein [Ceratobasidium sp. AG-Ba]